MDDPLESYIDKCRCCLEEINVAKIEIDYSIENKFFELTQINLVSSDMLASFICVECYEILQSYSTIRIKLIENQQRLENKMLSQCEFTTENEFIEEESECVEYEEIEVQLDRGNVQGIVKNEEQDQETEQLIQFIEQDEQDEQQNEENEEQESDEEEELRLEDIVKPEFLHYCLPKSQRNDKSSNQQQNAKKKKEIVEKQLICEECGKMFSNPVAVSQHITTVHRKIKFKCVAENCGRVFTTQLHLSKHVSVFHSNPDSHPCRICNKQFQSQADLNIHMNTIHPEGFDEKFKCEICSQHLISYKVYLAHMRKHREGKFVCEYCDKRFLQKVHLNNHLISHRDVAKN